MKDTIEEMDMSKFDMSDFADLMKAIRKIGIMQMMKKDMNKSGDGEEKIPGDNPMEEMLESSSFDTNDDDSEEEMEEMDMKPKKKEYTMFSLKSDSPRMEMEEEMGDKKMGRMMRKKLMGK